MKGNFEKAFGNITISAACLFFSDILGFISRSIFVRFLAVEYLGISGLFSNILTILSFTELGIGNIMVYSLYSPLKRNNQEEIKSLLSIYQKVYWGIVAVIVIAGTAINPFILFLIQEPPDIPENIHLLFSLYLISTAASYFLSYKKSIFLADQKNYIINVITFCIRILTVLVQILLLYLTHSFILYLVCQIVFSIITNLILNLSVNKHYPYLRNMREIKFDIKKFRNMLGDIKALSISKVSGIVANGTDNIIISKMFGLVPVGLLSNYTLLINSVNGIFYSALSSITSSIGNYNVDSSTEEKQSLFNQLFMAVFFLYSFVCSCLFVLTQPFIRLWLGNDFLMPVQVLFHMVLGIYVSGVNFSVYSFRTTAGMFKQAQWSYVSCAIANVFLSILMGKIMGVAGVLMATWVSKLFITEVTDAYYTFSCILKRSPLLYLIKYLGFALVAAVNCAVCLYAVELITVPGWFGFVIKAAVCCIVNLFLNIVLFSKSSTFNILFNRIKRLFFKENTK